MTTLKNEHMRTFLSILLLSVSSLSMIGSGPVNHKSIQHATHSAILTDTLPYSLNVIASVSNLFPGDVYFSNHVAAPTSTSGNRRLYIRRAGTIRVANVSVIAQGVIGSGESWSMYIRKNGTTDYLIERVGAATQQRIFSNDTMNVPVIYGDYIEIRSRNPSWVTLPTNVIFGGYLIVE